MDSWGRGGGGGGQETRVGIMLESAGSNGGPSRSAATSINVNQALRVYIAAQGARCTVIAHAAHQFFMFFNGRSCRFAVYSFCSNC